MTVEKLEPEIEEIIQGVRKPLTYIASEENAVFKTGALLHFCLIYPDLYELGIGSLGLNILYSALNGEKDIWAQRAYMPDLDMLSELESRNVPLFSLEEQKPLNEFDIIGFSLPHELCYTNILHILKTAHIPLKAADRNEEHPLVIAGGNGSYNPLPLAPFIDAFVIGEGEEVVVKIAKKIKNHKSKIKKLKALSAINGVWVPSCQPSTVNGQPVRKRLVKDINKVSYKPLVPATKGENRLVVELMRGCTAGCRFCQAGFIYRPLREKADGFAYKEAIEQINKCGLKSLSLLSLNTSDYSHIEPLVSALTEALAEKKIAISLPSLRLDDFSLDILQQIASVKKTGLTFAIEAGSQRLRNIINKRLSEEQIINTLGKVFASGWDRVKLYFMVGLPTETQKDLEELAALLKKIEATAKRNLGKRLARRLKIIVSVSNFVPKAHTPFQWVAQNNLHQLSRKHRFLMKNITGPVFKLRWHNARQSAVEGMLARGDERMAGVIERAFELGAIFDNFSERFDFSLWQKALTEAGLDFGECLKERPLREELPWSFIDCGVSKDFLKSEYKKGLEGIETADCRFDKCPQCGVCDKEVRNRFSSDFKVSGSCRLRYPAGAQPPVAGLHAVESPTLRCHPSAVTAKYRLILHKEGMYKYLSHLEWIAWIERRLRLAGVRLAMRGRYNPRPKLSFSAALPVGLASKKVYVDFQVLGYCTKKELDEKLEEAFSNAFVECGNLEG